ncbi:hypothetical protein EWM64_g6956 [Hericium alpestre]|uniref:Major facilitator superfamily (MFS) profile domain-containing protein n=1 Tax=Hericium alpestre TaxID=135208 RepID=A0A4Y9ZQ77_9AGAM|nr:hypothetical protein EWM64_g6956 [Hericium alpestre]
MSTAVELTDFSSALAERHPDGSALQEHLSISSRPPVQRLNTERTVVEPIPHDAVDKALGEEAKSVPAVVDPADAIAGAQTPVIASTTYPPISESEVGISVVEPPSESIAGWNGGATGALIPAIEKAFNIGYARVAILFISTFMGYAFAAVVAGAVSRRIGFGRALCLSVVIELVGVIALVNAINCSQQLGLCNAYFAILHNPLLYTGVLHGIYGLGAFASPLVATAMITRGVPYHLFYLTNLGMNVPVLGIVWFAFRDLQELPSRPEDVVPAGGASFRDTLKSRSVWTLSIFLMLYVGAEESVGGWIVSYVIEVRKGSPEGASWVASSFYLGIAIGRIALPALNTWLGERRAIFIYLALAVALEAVAWACLCSHRLRPQPRSSGSRSRHATRRRSRWADA